MKLLAWTLNHGENNMEDFYVVHETQAEADEHLRELRLTENNLFLYAIADITVASEPHWMEGEDG